MSFGKKQSKAKAWSQFSLYIRSRDCHNYALENPSSNTAPEAACITCKRVYPLKTLQAGHFIAGRNTAQLFDEIAVNSQCYGCNIMKKGATDEYWLFMEQKHGRAEIDRIIAQKHETLKLSIQDYQDIEKKYKEKTADLLARQT